MPEFDDVKVKDQLGRPDETGIIVKRKEETLTIDGPLVVEQNTLGHAEIVGSSTNSIVGVNTNTQDGLQQTVGGGGRVLSTLAVLNPSNIFTEEFMNTRFKDTANTTATWDTANHEAKFTAGQIIQSEIIYKDGLAINTVKPVLVFERSGRSSIAIDTSTENQTLNFSADW